MNNKIFNLTPYFFNSVEYYQKNLFFGTQDNENFLLKYIITQALEIGVYIYFQNEKNITNPF